MFSFSAFYLMQDVFNDLRSKNGNFPKENVARALRFLGLNPGQAEVRGEVTARIKLSFVQ